MPTTRAEQLRFAVAFVLRKPKIQGRKGVQDNIAGGVEENIGTRDRIAKGLGGNQAWASELNRVVGAVQVGTRMQRPTREYCDQKIAICQQLLANTSDPDQQTELQEVIRAWTDLRIDLDTPLPKPPPKGVGTSRI
jgi:hypothetical protein